LQVYRKQNFRVIETFMLPTMLLANLSAVILMIAETAADCGDREVAI